MREFPVWWRKKTLFSTVLLPFSWIFAGITALRRLYYRQKRFAGVTLPVQVIVLGNISVGGNGKTPVTIALARALSEHGRTVGIVSRGYGGAAVGTMVVRADSSPRMVGDEPLMIFRQTGLPVVVGKDRLAAARRLLAEFPGTSHIISDDGLQHYRLPRTVELAVIAPDLSLGNARLLPAGPLREVPSRLDTVDAVLYSGIPERSLPLIPPAFSLRIENGAFRWLDSGTWFPAADLPRGKPRYALTAIARPERFFARLAALSLTLAEARALPDHYPFSARDAAFAGDGIVIMTEKDAVKTGDFPPDLRTRIAVLRYDMTIPDALLALIFAKEPEV